jgi:hypothetical protein
VRDSQGSAQQQGDAVIFSPTTSLNLARNGSQARFLSVSHCFGSSGRDYQAFWTIRSGATRVERKSLTAISITCTEA